MILSHNHICLLKGLHDQRGGRARSRVEWIRASSPYQQRYSSESSHWPLKRAIITINRKWVREVKKGRCIETTLTKRGRDIVERKVPSRIVGIGPFRGFPKERKEKPDRYATLNRELREYRTQVQRASPVSPLAATESAVSVAASPSLVDAYPVAAARTIADSAPTQRPALPEPLRRAIDFANMFGLPLLEPNPRVRTRGTIMAVSTGIDRFFRIACREELDMRVMRRWHLVWTRAAIDVGMVPAGYLSAFEGFDETDILHHLREIRDDTDHELDRYVLAYRGKHFLSRVLRDKWFDEEIDLTTTDMTPECRGDFVRARSEQYRIAMRSVGPDGIMWRDPETEKLIGRAVKKSASAWEMEVLEVTTPAALSCLQHHWDETGVGLNIETRYIPRNL